jgi:hypothetical protein
MAKGSDNEFPSLLVKEGTAPANPAAGDQRIFIDSTSHHIKRVNSSGTVVDMEAVGASSAILAVKSHAPSGTTYTVSSTTLAAADATNLIVTFTAPSTGNVFVRLDGYGDAALQQGLLNASGGAQVGNTFATPAGTGIHTSVHVYVTGLTSGNSYTLQWAIAAKTGTANMYIGTNVAGGFGGPGIMVVTAAP